MLNMNPWLKIWTSPKETIQAIISRDPKYRFSVLCFIYGFVWCLSMAQTLMLGSYYNSVAIMILSALLAVPMGFILMSITTAFFWVAGKLFRGASHFYHIRAAVAWANVPNIVTLVTWLMLVAVYGSDIFVSPNPEMTQGFNFADLAMLIQVAAGIWGLVIIIGGVAQAQRFSNWRSFGSLIIVSCLWLALTFVLMYALIASSNVKVAMMGWIQ